MKKQLEDIPRRVKELREILDISAYDMAAKLGMSLQDYASLESGGVDIPVSTLYELASILGVDFTVLLTGETPKMNTYSVVRAGEGVRVERYQGYSYDSVAFNFIGREMEPMIVSLAADDAHKSLVVHSGQEFNYCLEGRMKITLGNRDFVLSPGDSIYFNPTIPHGQSAVTETAKFLTVIKE